jgi:hypothetical protein
MEYTRRQPLTEHPATEADLESMKQMFSSVRIGEVEKAVRVYREIAIMSSRPSIPLG